MFPDVSPDGKSIVYTLSSSAKPNTSAEIWLLDISSKATEQLTTNGTFPTFSADGKTVFFERERKCVIALELKSREETELLSSCSNSSKNKFSELTGYQVVKPRVSANKDKVFFTSDKGGRWHAYMADLKNSQLSLLGEGCEPVPFNQQNSAAWVTSKGMFAKSGFTQQDLSTNAQMKLHDRDDPLGHEYFPTFSQDDSFLLFSASSSNEHSHESAKYQLFVKDLRSGELHQLTKGNHTNRWPKQLAVR